MSMAGLFKKLLPLDRMQGTIIRFPVSAVCACLATMLGFLLNHDLTASFDKLVLARIFYVLVLGFFWSGAVRLYQWSNGRGDKFYYLASVAVMAILFVMLAASPHIKIIYFSALALPACIALISVAGDLGQGRSALSYWAFNSKTWLGVLLSISAGFIWAVGACAALGAVNMLFGLKVSGKYFFDIWVVAMGLLSSLYALSWVPDKFDYDDEECRAPVQVNFIINWVLGPLSFVYLLILYAYFVKVGIEGQMPKGVLSSLTMGFAGVGIVTYFMSYPLRESGSFVIRFMHKYLFMLLILPVGMQILSLSQRIGAYGITEQRYLVGLSAVFFVFCIAYALSAQIRKAPVKMHLMLFVLSVLLFIGGLGPLSAVNVSERSQVARLESLLLKNNILQDGQIVKVQGNVSFEDRREISSRLSYLSHRAHIKKLHDWFEFQGRENAQYFNVSEATKMMGIEFVSKYDAEKSLSAEKSFLLGNFASDVLFNVNGYEYALQSHYNARVDRKPKSYKWTLAAARTEEPERFVTAQIEDNEFVFTFDGEAPVRLPLRPIIEKSVLANEFKELEQAEWPLGEHGKLLIKRIHGKYGPDEKLLINGIDFILLVR